MRRLSARFEIVLQTTDHPWGEVIYGMSVPIDGIKGHEALLDFAFDASQLLSREALRFAEGPLVEAMTEERK